MLTHSTYLLLFYLALAVGLFNTSLAVILIVRNKRNLLGRSNERSNTNSNTETTKNKIAIEDTITADTTRKVINIGSRIALYVVLVTSGYIWRVLEVYSTTDTIHNIKILQSLPERRYVYEVLANHETYQTQLCDDFDPKFPAGTTLEFITFENRISCWSVASSKLGYKYKRGVVNE